MVVVVPPFAYDLADLPTASPFADDAEILPSDLLTFVGKSLAVVVVEAVGVGIVVAVVVLLLLRVVPVDPDQDAIVVAVVVVEE
jgi:hypothetical protein